MTEAERVSFEKVKAWLESDELDLKELMSYFRCAMMETETKFNVLDEEFSLVYDQNPIETIKTRLKSIDSIAEKIVRKNYPLDIATLENLVTDIAGIRVICSFTSDIYKIANAFLKQDDVTLIQKKDYIIKPKENGYRSLHLVVSIPIFLYNQKKMMNVEVQFRTIAMDCWASLEHKIRYKKNLEADEHTDSELYGCAMLCAQLDERMDKIHTTEKEEN